MVNSRPLLLYFCLFYLFTMGRKNFADVGTRTADLRCWKWPLYQLSHHHYLANTSLSCQRESQPKLQEKPTVVVLLLVSGDCFSLKVQFSPYCCDLRSALFCSKQTWLNALSDIEWEKFVSDKSIMSFAICSKIWPCTVDDFKAVPYHSSIMI